MKYFSQRTEKEIENKYIAGAKLIESKELNKEIKKDKEPISIIIGDVNFPISSEVKHTLIVGRPGVGKTVCLTQILQNLKNRNSKGVVYDFKGDYLAKFFNPEKDIIFNPLDSRGIKWSIFSEIKTPMDIQAIASSLIPDPIGQDPFWIQAGRNVFTGILHYCYQQNKKTNKDIWETLTLPLTSLANILRGTKGAEAGYTYIQDPASKQALGVVATMMTYTSFFEYMTDGDDDFSISSWISQDEKRGFIFITNYSDIQNTLKPVLSLFIDLVSRKLLSLSDNINRRIYFLIDEFGTLQKLSSIKNLLTLSRSKGGSVWLGIQDIGQIEKLYGRELRQAIVNACGTNIIFNVADPDTAQFFSRKIGDIEYSYIDETKSMGVEDYRDGISLSRKEKTKPLILPSDIMNLRDLKCFIKIPNYYITQTSLKYKSFTDVNPSFLMREGLILSEYSEPTSINIVSHEINKEEEQKKDYDYTFEF
ncbi:MAG: type IV secretion system DNA-binding domain-containing protein [candidate division WOR-3 bacterium]